MAYIFREVPKQLSDVTYECSSKDGVVVATVSSIYGGRWTHARIYYHGWLYATKMELPKGQEGIDAGMEWCAWFLDDYKKDGVLQPTEECGYFKNHVNK